NAAPSGNVANPSLPSPYFGVPPENSVPFGQPLPPPPAGAPGAAATTLSIVAPPNGTIGLSWNGVPGAVAYRIYDTLASAPLNYSVAQTVPQSIGQIVSSGLLPGLTPGAPYLIQIRAVDPNGLESPVPAAVQITGAPPIAGGAGTSLTVVSTTGTSVTLSWMPVPGATFMVLQSSSPSGPFAPAITSAVSGNGAMVTGLQPNVTYYFQVVPIDALGNQGAPSNIASATTSGGPPAATPRVSVGALTATSAALSWTPIPLAAGYQVLQATNPTGPFIPASMVNAGPSGATVVNLMPGTLYY